MKACKIPESEVSPSDPVTSPLPSTAASRPDQPLSHVHPPTHPTHPLANTRVPCYGDQLTRVHLAGAIDLRAGCHTAEDRLDHIHPIKVADLHCKRSFLKVIAIK
jgi:hypothetical protein